MANEKNLYDKNGNYDIKNCLKKYEDNYDGVDVVVLWPTYPQLGFDNRMAMGSPKWQERRLISLGK